MEKKETKNVMIAITIHFFFSAQVKTIGKGWNGKGHQLIEIKLINDVTRFIIMDNIGTEEVKMQ